MAGACTEGVDTGFVALGYGKVAVLGVVQGITELLPISSTAHMRIVPSFLGWQDPGSAFSAAMQLAALAAVISYFWADVRWLLFGSLSALGRRDFSDRALRFSLGIVIATIPIGICGLLLSKQLNACGTPLRSLWVIGASCIVMGLLLAVAEIYAVHKRTTERVSIVDFLIVGIAQTGALIPGVSRSGSTLTAGLFLNFKREEAARFSFLIGLPAIALAGMKELYILWKAGLSLEGWGILAVGLLVASISAFFAIWGLLRFLERFSSWPFVVYRIGLGIFLLVGVSIGWFS
ncbi:MAG: undecaprenyl-diphosphatase UppP [Beijerinckiaceae bacterium]|nr:undecaprenyl-diphosphatase UppP [Beijerinckiaceae bacterium]